MGIRLGLVGIGAVACLLAGVSAAVRAAPATAETVSGTALSGGGGNYAVVAPAAQIPRGARNDGAAPSDVALHLVVVLRSRDATGMAATAKAISTPGNRKYRHFLTPPEITKRFGASPASLAAVRSWLAGGGATVERATGDGLDIPAIATVGTRSATAADPGSAIPACRWADRVRQHAATACSGGNIFVRPNCPRGQYAGPADPAVAANGHR